MNEEAKKTLIQNSLASAALAFACLLAAFMVFLLDSSASKREKVFLRSMFADSEISLAVHARDPAFKRIYRIGFEGKDSKYGAFAAVGPRSRLATVAFVFSSSGDLEAARFVGSLDSKSPLSNEDFLALFLGKGATGAKGFPRSRADLTRPDIAAGASITLVATSEVLTRMSLLARDLEAANL